jgi:BMFP domain-containing protein YqiC
MNEKKKFIETGMYINLYDTNYGFSFPIFFCDQKRTFSVPDTVAIDKGKMEENEDYELLTDVVNRFRDFLSYEYASLQMVREEEWNLAAEVLLTYNESSDELMIRRQSAINCEVYEKENDPKRIKVRKPKIQIVDGGI